MHRYAVSKVRALKLRVAEVSAHKDRPEVRALKPRIAKIRARKARSREVRALKSLPDVDARQIGYVGLVTCCNDVIASVRRLESV